MEKDTPGVTNLYHMMGPENFSKALYTNGPAGIRNMLRQFQPPPQQTNQNGFQNVAALSPQGPSRQQMMAQNAILQPQFQQALPEDTGMAPVEQMQPQQYIPPNQPQVVPEDQEMTLRQREDKIAQSPAYGYNSFSDVFNEKHQKAIREQAQAEDEAISRKAEAISRKADLEIKKESAKEKFEKPAQTYLDRTRNQLRTWKSQESKLKSLKSSVPKMGPGLPLRKWASERFGIAPGLLMSTNEQFSDKIASSLMEGIGDKYKGPLKIVELATFVKSNPSLLNSPDAIGKISDLQLKSGNLIKEEYDESRKLRKKYESQNKKLPKDFEDEVLEKMLPKMEKVSNEIEDLVAYGYELAPEKPGMVIDVDTAGKFIDKFGKEEGQKRAAQLGWKL
jgi:hypothetical protein